MQYKIGFGNSVVLVLTLCLCIAPPLQGAVSKEPPSASQVLNANHISVCDNFAHRFAICSTCIVMFVLVVGILVLIFYGKLRPHDIGSWKGGTGLAAVLV